MYSGMRLSDCEFVAVDLETTGPTPGRNSVIEIGAALIRDGRVVDTLEVMVRPTEPVPPSVESLTGISASMLVGAGNIDAAMTRFRDFAEGKVLVAHNYRFDLGFLDFEAERLWGDHWPRPAIDTLSLARRLHPGRVRYSLRSLSESFDTATRPTHRALADAVAAAEVLLAMMPDLERIGVHTVGQLAQFCGLDRQTSLAARLRLTTALPDDPGVFVFYDATGRVIYVGRAKSLRARTRSYFYPGAEHGRHDVGEMVSSLRAVATTSQLDAALLELRLLDRYDPELNPAAQRSRIAYLIHADSTAFPGLRVVRSPRARGTHAGPFTSKWAATTLAERLSVAYGLRLCARRIDARLAARPCEYRGAGCPSPCVLDVDRSSYRARLADAMAALAGDGSDARARFERLQRGAADSQRYEEAIRFRDGIRALERGLGTLRVVREASERDVIAVEESEYGVIVHLVRDGLRAAVVRGPRWAVAGRLERAVRRVYFSDHDEFRVIGLDGRRISELLIVSGFLSTGEHLEVPVTDEATTLAALARAIGVATRTPRRRHP